MAVRPGREPSRPAPFPDRVKDGPLLSRARSRSKGPLSDQVADASDACGQSRSWVCAVTRRRFPVGASPTRQPLQPEATGAGMEATKCLKPSGSGSRIGDRASVQAATRVNAEQASKRTMCRPTRQPFRGRLIRLPGGACTHWKAPPCHGAAVTRCVPGIIHVAFIGPFLSALSGAH